MNRGCLLGQTHCSGNPISAARARCLNTLLSMVARGLPLSWPRLTTPACCNRGAHAESRAILRKPANYTNGRRPAASPTRRRGSKLLNIGRFAGLPAPGKQLEDADASTHHEIFDDHISYDGIRAPRFPI